MSRENKFSSLNFNRTKKEGNKVNLDKYDGSEETNSWHAFPRHPRAAKLILNLFYYFPKVKPKVTSLIVPHVGLVIETVRTVILISGMLSSLPLQFQNNFLI